LINTARRLLVPELFLDYKSREFRVCDHNTDSLENDKYTAVAVCKIKLFERETG
jgi:hypothetical protein